MEGKFFVKAALFLGAALFASSLVLAFSFSQSRSTHGSVSVRGLAEREVDADLAVWPVTFSVSGNDLAVIRRDTLAGISAVREYLSQFHFTDDEIIVKEPAITDTSANPYMSPDERRSKYIAKIVVIVRSSNVAEVKQALANSLDLTGKGVAISKDYDSTVKFSYTALNAIKPEMIAEATKNARIAAEQFARDSGSKVGKIMAASQGLFSIDSVDESLPDKMTVRVVTTMTYALD